MAGCGNSLDGGEARIGLGIQLSHDHGGAYRKGSSKHRDTHTLEPLDSRTANERGLARESVSLRWFRSPPRLSVMATHAHARGKLSCPAGFWLAGFQVSATDLHE